MDTETPEQITLLLNFLYTGSAHHSAPDPATFSINIMKMADKYCLQFLEDATFARFQRLCESKGIVEEDLVTAFQAVYDEEGGMASQRVRMEVVRYVVVRYGIEFRGESQQCFTAFPARVRALAEGSRLFMMDLVKYVAETAADGEFEPDEEDEVEGGTGDWEGNESVDSEESGDESE